MSFVKGKCKLQKFFSLARIINKLFSSEARKYSSTLHSALLTLHSKKLPPKRQLFIDCVYSASTFSEASAFGLPRYSGSCMPAISKSSVRGGTDL